MVIESSQVEMFLLILQPYIYVNNLNFFFTLIISTLTYANLLTVLTLSFFFQAVQGFAGSASRQGKSFVALIS